VFGSPCTGGECGNIASEEVRAGTSHGSVPTRAAGGLGRSGCRGSRAVGWELGEDTCPSPGQGVYCWDVLPAPILSFELYAVSVSVYTARNPVYDII